MTHSGHCVGWIGISVAVIPEAPIRGEKRDAGNPPEFVIPDFRDCLFVRRSLCEFSGDVDASDHSGDGLSQPLTRRLL